jgi:hypothetical protein
MPFPSDTGSKREDIQTAWLGARSWAGQVKQAAEQVRALSAAGSLASSNLLDFVTYLADAKAQLALYAVTPGLEAYAQAQVNDPTLDIGRALHGMLAAMEATRQWIMSHFPHDGDGFLLAQTFAADGRQVDRVFGAAQTEGLRLALDALIATID